MQIGRMTGYKNEIDKQTIGLLTVYHNLIKVFSCFTLELPWVDNKQNISCIPIGIYTVVKRTSDKYGLHFHIKDVSDRSYILIHQANFIDQLRGCIAVGDKLTDINGDGLRDVTNSKSTMNKLLNVLPNSFQLEIVNLRD